MYPSPPRSFNTHLSTRNIIIKYPPASVVDVYPIDCTLFSRITPNRKHRVFEQLHELSYTFSGLAMISHYYLRVV